MRRTTILLTILTMLCGVTGLTLIASQDQVDLETRIERLLLREHDFEIAAIEGLAPRSKIRTILLRMVAKYRNADSDREKSLDFVLLDRAVFALGQLKEAQALQPLSDLLADRTIDKNIRGRAADALGKIDADGSKDVLLRSLDLDNPDYITVRMSAIEALGNSHDSAVITFLRRYLESEKDEHLKQLASESIRQIRSRNE